MPQIELADNLLHLPTFRGSHEDFAGDIGGLGVGRDVSIQALHRGGEFLPDGSLLVSREAQVVQEDSE